MIKLSNGHILRYVAASGALGFDGRGWPWERPLVWARIIRPELFLTAIKSLTLRPTQGNLGLTKKGNTKLWNFHRCIRFISGGAVNRLGLTNGGLDWWLDHVEPTIKWGRQPLASSMFGTKEEIIQMLMFLDQLPFRAHKLNVSCTNTGHASAEAEEVIATVRAAKEESTKPLIVKVGVQQDFVTIARGLVGIAEAIALNSVPWNMVFGDKPSPLDGLEAELISKGLGKGKGGVSGIPAQQLNWAAVRAIRTAVPEMPVIAPSVMSYGDVAKARAAGGQAISFGACFMRTPPRPTRIVLRDMKENPEI